MRRERGCCLLQLSPPLSALAAEAWAAVKSPVRVPAGRGRSPWAGAWRAVAGGRTRTHCLLTATPPSVVVGPGPPRRRRVCRVGCPFLAGSRKRFAWSQRRAVSAASVGDAHSAAAFPVVSFFVTKASVSTAGLFFCSEAVVSVPLPGAPSCCQRALGHPLNARAQERAALLALAPLGQSRDVRAFRWALSTRASGWQGAQNRRSSVLGNPPEGGGWSRVSQMTVVPFLKGSTLTSTRQGRF